MPYNPETEQFFQAPATIVDSTPDGDTVQEGFDDRLTPAMAGVYTDLNLLKENGMIGVGIPATTTSRGIGRVATLADMEPGAIIENGPAFLDVEGGVITTTPTAHAVPQAGADGRLNVGFIPGVFIGDIRLLPFRAADLAAHCPGWYFANGDQYSLTSDVGVALNGLPESFKTDWGIVVTGDNISVPNLFYSDGRGLFLRAGASPGVLVNDAIRNMTGDLAFFCGGAMYKYTGVFSTSYSATWTRDGSAHVSATNGIARFNASSVVPTADENRPVHVTFTPAIFLDV